MGETHREATETILLPMGGPCPREQCPEVVQLESCPHTMITRLSHSDLGSSVKPVRVPYGIML